MLAVGLPVALSKSGTNTHSIGLSPLLKFRPSLALGGLGTQKLTISPALPMKVSGLMFKMGKFSKLMLKVVIQRPLLRTSFLNLSVAKLLESISSSTKRRKA